MNEGNRVKLLAVGLVVFLLGMGSSWFLLRSPSPKPVVIVDRGPGEKERRYIPPTDKQKPDRRRVTVRPPKSTGKDRRETSKPRESIREKRGAKREGSRKRSEPMRPGC